MTDANHKKAYLSIVEKLQPTLQNKTDTCETSSLINETNFSCRQDVSIWFALWKWETKWPCAPTWKWKCVQHPKYTFKHNIYPCSLELRAYCVWTLTFIVQVIAWGRVKLVFNFTRVFKVSLIIEWAKLIRKTWGSQLTVKDMTCEVVRTLSRQRTLLNKTSTNSKDL